MQGATEMPELVLLALAAAAGGAINAVAGGGTLLTYPALFAVLGPGAGVVANATSTVALFPGSLAAMGGYRQELYAARRWILLLLFPSLAGGLLGSLLLILLPDSTFEALVPWLILAAALLFALQPQIARWTGIGMPHGEPSSRTAAGIVLFQLGVATYGGYFGAGIGILMLSALAMMGLADIHQMNALKTLFASTINGVSVVIFVVSGKVLWPYALLMALSAILGGYAGARTARRLNRTLVRRGVVLIGFTLAAYYLHGQFFRVTSP